jgi:hypothetical protein
LRALLSTLRSKRWWSKNATLGERTETSAFNIDGQQKSITLSLFDHSTSKINKSYKNDYEIMLCYKLTCNEVTLLSSSDMYCSFLTRDLCADCLFAKILMQKKKEKKKN